MNLHSLDVKYGRIFDSRYKLMVSNLGKEGGIVNVMTKEEAQIQRLYVVS